MRYLLVLFLLCTGCTEIMNKMTYDPKCVDGFYVYAGGFPIHEWDNVGSMFCEEVDGGSSNSSLRARRCMRVGGDPRIRYTGSLNGNVYYIATKCFNTMAGVKE